ncbi:TatD family hydrolase [Desulfofundulus salinus]|uniref:TatD family deoxyribonuclease n=1 Tax=Desulfofundulus salinus TaxID=2419843 RepID=A0A494WWN2_9FIRM|nr:TatD family hydrolase [Desulfofundulus salinum]RKO67958.1 TatD family deoxyribonuclease [Desulfofundulus salinum]
MIHLIDSHAHLDDRKFEADREEMLDRAQKAGVVQIINAGYDLPSSARSISLAAKYPFVFAAVGIHPHDAGGVPEDYLVRLREMSRRRGVVAIGEIGLDYYRDLSPRDVQQRVFREQLALARELGLPVIIHDRDAHGDILDILRRDGVGPAGGVMHCFAGSWEMARECMAMGFYISFAGPVTYPNARRPKEVAARVPLERLLVETDAPYLTPQARRGNRNEPAYVRYVAEEIAALKGVTLEELARATTANARCLFGLPGAGA